MTYKYIVKDNKTTREHRVILNLTSKDDVVVHHVDGNKMNNNKDNLVIMSNSEHAKLHAQERVRNTPYVDFICPTCNNTFKRKKSLVKYRLKCGQNEFFCSKACVSKDENKGTFVINKTYEDIIKKALNNNMTGYAISKQYNINKKTVYNHINRIKNDIQNLQTKTDTRPVL